MNILTDEEIEACATDDGSDDMAFARAIEAAVLAKVDAIDTSKERVEKYSANRQVGVEPVATLWREKNQKLYPGPLWKLTPSGVELPLGIEHQLYHASALAALQQQLIEAHAEIGAQARKNAELRAENERLTREATGWRLRVSQRGYEMQLDDLRTQLAAEQADYRKALDRITDLECELGHALSQLAAMKGQQ